MNMIAFHSILVEESLSMFVCLKPDLGQRWGKKNTIGDFFIHEKSRE